MVAVTRAAVAARHQQPLVSSIHATKKKKRTKKKEIVKQVEIA